MTRILLRREYAGFVLGAVSGFIIYELTEPLRALLLCVLIFIGFPLARKWFN